MSVSHGVERIRNSKHFVPALMILGLALFNIGIKVVYFTPTHTSDSAEYLETAAWMRGDDVPSHPNRLLKPLAPLGIAAIAHLTGGDLVLALEIEAALMYFALALVAYAFFYSFTRRRLYGYLGAALLITGYPALNYGLDLYTETGAWAFYILGLLASWKYLNAPSFKWLLIGTFAVSIGFLWKEYSVLAGVALFLAIVFHPGLQIREKIKALLTYGLIAGGILGLWMGYVYLEFHYSYIDWYRIGTADLGTEVSEYTLYHIGKSLFATLLLAWALVPFGLFKWRTFSPIEKRFILLLILPSLMFLLWGYVSSRLYYVVAPFALLFALHGTRELFKSRIAMICIAFGLIMLADYAWLFANTHFRGLL